MVDVSGLATATQVPFAPDVFTWPDEEPRLIGGRCTSCSAITFPWQPGCPRCGAPEMERHSLPRTGTLWTWTTQEFLPKEPYAGGETEETFRPYAVGMVQLRDEVRVEGRLTTAAADVLRIGMEVELVIIPFRTEPDGTEVMVFAFSPVGEGRG
jgi:uncharacterized OB-fold protein